MKVWLAIAVLLSTSALAEEHREVVVCQASGVILHIDMKYTLTQDNPEFGLTEGGFGGATINGKYLGMLTINTARYDIRYRKDNKTMRVVINRDRTAGAMGEMGSPKPTIVFAECHPASQHGSQKGR
jgi:hypothetical protein